MRNHGRTWAALAAAGTALALAGCGSASAGDDSSSEDSGTKVVSAVENNSKPLSFMDDDGNLTGYEVELLRAIDDALPDYQITIEGATADGASIGLDSDKYQLIAGGLYKTAERESKYLLAGPNGASAIKIYEKKGADYASLKDLAGKSVAPVSPNGGIYNLLTDYNTANPNQKIDIKTSADLTTAEALQGIADGTYDALVKPSNLGEQQIIDQLGLDVVAAEEPVKVNGTYFALKKSDADLEKAVTGAIEKLKDDGTVSKLSEQFFGEDVTQYTVNE